MEIQLKTISSKLSLAEEYIKRKEFEYMDDQFAQRLLTDSHTFILSEVDQLKDQILLCQHEVDNQWAKQVDARHNNVLLNITNQKLAASVYVRDCFIHLSAYCIICILAVVRYILFTKSP